MLPTPSLPSSLAASVRFTVKPVYLSNQIAHYHHKNSCDTVARRLVVLAARSRERQASTGSSSSSSRRAVGPAVTDGAGLLRALIQLASSTTILVGSHQSHALLEALEPQLQDQLHRVPVDTLASGLWAMTRLQLQPSSETLKAIATYLLEPQQLRTEALQGSVTCSSSASSNTRLAACSSRVFAGLCYSLNFYMLRDLGFWAAAASAGLQHLASLKPTCISNLLQGIAASGWTVNPDPQVNTAADQPTVDQRAQPTGAASSSSVSSSIVRDQQGAVASLVHAVEQQLLSQPQQLQQWRMRDLSQMCQAYTLMGYNCTLLFAVVANHLLEVQSSSSSSQTSSSSSSSGRRLPAVLQDSDNTRIKPGQQQWTRLPQQQQQQQQQHWNILSHALNASKQQHSKGAGVQRLAACRPADAAGLAWAYVAAFCTNRMLLQELARVVTAKAGQLHAADCCRLLWAYATADVVDPAMLAAVTAATAEEMHSVLPRTAAGSIWSLARMRYEAPAFMEAALDRLAVCMEATQYTTSSRSSARHYGSTTEQVPAAAATSSTQSKQHPVRVNSSSVGNEPSVLQQLLHSPSPALLSAGPVASNTPDGELSMLGTFHKIRHSNQKQQQQQQPASDGEEDDLIQQLHSSIDDEHDMGSPWQQQQQQQQRQQQEQPMQQPQQWQWQQAFSVSGDVVHCSYRDVAQAVYACGSLQHYNGAFFRVLRAKLLQLLPGFTDSQLVMVLWGLARLNCYDAAQMEATAAELVQRTPRLRAPLTALAAWCFATLKHRDPQLFKALAHRAVVLAGQGLLRPLDAVQLVRAAARIGYRDNALLKAAAQVLQQQMPRLSDSMIISSLWAFAISGVFYDELFAAGFAKISTLPAEKARPLLLLQLFQTATLLADAFAVAALQPPAQLPPRLMAAAARQWMSTNRRSPVRRPSSFQASVSEVLRDGLGLAVQQEVLTDDGLFSIDVAVEWQGRRVAVEVDGPKHFTNSIPYCLLGSSLAKQRCLQARGWAVLSVPFHTWNGLSALPDYQQHQQGDAAWQQRDPSIAAAAAWGGQHSGTPAPIVAAQVHQCVSHDGEGAAAAAEAVAAARARYLAAALDEAVATADMPRGVLRQVCNQ